MSLNLSVSDIRNINLLVFENDPVPELVSRFLSYLGQTEHLYLSNEYHEMFSSSIIYFIETKLIEIGHVNKRSTKLYSDFPFNPQS